MAGWRRQDAKAGGGISVPVRVRTHHRFDPLNTLLTLQRLFLVTNKPKASGQISARDVGLKILGHTALRP
jgi:hypothetical protein